MLLFSDRTTIRSFFCKAFELQSLCFPALPVRAIDSGYELRVSEADREGPRFRECACNWRHGSSALALIALHEDDPTANLLAPIVINLRTQSAAQCIDPDMRYSHRYRLIATLELAS